jgi:hypothetical protein
MLEDECYKRYKLMKLNMYIVFGLFFAGASCQAQEWEIGAIGGYADNFGVNVKRDSLSASAGFKPGFLVGGRAGQNFERLSGEITYLFRAGAARLDGNGQKPELAATQNLITADFLWHFTPRNASVRPFVVFGGGARFINGTGTEHAYQPLSQLAVLTQTSEVQGTAVAGFGVKVRIKKNYQFRAEFRDYLGPSSSQVIATTPGAQKTGILNDLMGLIGFGWVF